MRWKVWNSIWILFCLVSCQPKTTEVQTATLESWQFQYQGVWHAADVPGNNFSDLLNHAFIPDPFYGTNEDSVQWVAEREWVYRTTFTSTNANNQTLIFNGLDTYAKVFLNDSLILESDNMFRSYEVEVSDHLKTKNSLRIHFLPPHLEEAKKKADLGYELPGGSRVFTRKAGFHYGWDWGPKITPAGIWRPVELQSWDACKLTDVHISQDNIKDSIANLMVGIEIESSCEKTISITTWDKTWKDFKLKKGINRLNMLVNIPNPKRWWPRGHGEQHMYDISVSIADENRLIDTRTEKVGIRTIHVAHKESTAANDGFYFKVNGKPIFMKGANYIPQDNLQNRVTDQDYRDLLQDAADANMNMLRVWGGGIYEEDIFYDLCDSLGILLWQDFMFACAMYPSDSLFLENVKEEAIQNVKRLRNHPSIALWCGNNENSEGWHRWGWQDVYTEEQKEAIWNGYQRVFNDILPKAVGDEHWRFYWESSPKFGRGDARHQSEGDAHYWGVWHDAEPFENFEKKVPRFMSEFGFQSFPVMSTIAQFADSSQWHLDSEVMKSHQKHPRGNSLILEYMQREYPVPSEFDKFVYASQILQAEGMRIGLEAHRRGQPYCMGTLYWQLNDCWPVASWSGRDYYGNWKALHYVAQDVFAPVALSVAKAEDGSLSIWAMSELNKPLADTLLVILCDLKGNSSITTEAISLPLNGAFKIKELKPLEQNQFMICALKIRGVQSKTVFASPIKEMEFEQPNIQANWSGDTLILSTDVPAFQVYLHGVEGHFSDNFFTLLPGKETLITYKGKEGDRNNLIIWSLADLNK